MKRPLSTLSPGDVLHETRYRLLQPLNIPSSQQAQNWLASDTQSAGLADPLTGQILRNALASQGHGNVSIYLGISGRISFDAQGKPLDKAFVLLDVEQRNGQNMIILRQIAGKF